jgi:hypothetical protein
MQAASESNFILRYRGAGAAPAADRAVVRSCLTVLHASPGMMLVRGSERQVRSVAGQLGRWSVTAESSVELPDARPRLARPARSK